jgi:beta-galactosidase
LAGTVSVANEERDAIAVGFIPDYWMTESVYPKSGLMTDIAANLRRHRFGGPGMATARAMMHLTFRYTAVNIQDHDLDVATTPVLALASAKHMDPALQQKLVNWLHSGGRLFLHGEVPSADMLGEPCTILIDALGLTPAGVRWADHRYFLSVNADGWAAPRPELRAGFAQTFKPLPEGTIFRVYGTDEACGFDIRVGKGRVIVVTAEIPTDLDFFRKAFAELGAEPGLTHDHPMNGIFLSSVMTPDGDRFIHALNFDGVDKAIHVLDGGEALFEGRAIMLRRRDGVMLPINLNLGEARIAWSTAEIVELRPDGITVRLTGDQDSVSVVTERGIVPSTDHEVVRGGDSIVINSRLRGTGEELLKIDWT